MGNLKKCRMFTFEHEIFKRSFDTCATKIKTSPKINLMIIKDWPEVEHSSKRMEFNVKTTQNADFNLRIFMILPEVRPIVAKHSPVSFACVLRLAKRSNDQAIRH